MGGSGLTRGRDSCLWVGRLPLLRDLHPQCGSKGARFLCNQLHVSIHLLQVLVSLLQLGVDFLQTKERTVELSVELEALGRGSLSLAVPYP